MTLTEQQKKEISEYRLTMIPDISQTTKTVREERLEEALEIAINTLNILKSSSRTPSFINSKIKQIEDVLNIRAIKDAQIERLSREWSERSATTVLFNSMKSERDEALKSIASKDSEIERLLVALEKVAVAHVWDCIRNEHHYRGIDAGYAIEAEEVLKQIKGSK